MRRWVAIFILLFAGRAFAADPVLCFTDLINGPKTGVGDGLGSGAIVTVWGWNLGSTQGASTITVDGVAAAHVYYWENADVATGNSGPAELYTYHKMQEIAFSIPSGASDGAVKIKVTVGGVASNELDFYIRAGDIFYVASTGGGTTGSWASPFASVNAAIADADFGIGDIIYIKDNYTESSSVAANKIATTNNDCAIVSYPGVLYQNSSGILSYSGGTYVHPHWVLSKLKVYNNSTPISPSGMWRIIGCEITDNTEADGQGGAVSTNGDQGVKNASEGPIKCYGNYIHDFGFASTSSLHHVFYLSNRSRDTVEADDGNCYECILDHTSDATNKPYNGSGSWQTYWESSSMGAIYCAAWATSTAYDGGQIYGFELGWNYLLNNQARNGLHVYDEHECGGYLGTMDIHHNAVLNQAGASINIGTLAVYNQGSTPCMAQDIRVYSNLSVEPGQSPFGGYAGFNIYGQKMSSSVYVYNNTFYGYSGTEAAMDVNGPGGSADYDFAGNWYCVNNIFFDTQNTEWTLSGYPSKTPSTFATTYFYNGGDATPSAPPTWATNAIETDPGLVAPGSNDYAINGSSGANDSGSAYLAAAPYSQYGVDGSVLSTDIGAFGFGEAAPTATPVPSSLGIVGRPGVTLK